MAENFDILSGLAATSTIVTALNAIAFAKRLKRKGRRKLHEDDKLVTSDPKDFAISKTIPRVVEVTSDSSDCSSDDCDINISMDTSNTSIDSDPSLESESAFDTSFDANSEVTSICNFELDESVFSTNAKPIDSLSELEISAPQSYDMNIVSSTADTKQGNTNVKSLNEHGAQSTKNMKHIEESSKCDISTFRASDMSMVLGNADLDTTSTKKVDHIETMVTDNCDVTATVRNKKWIDDCSRLDISMYQACDMNMMTGTTNTGKSNCFDIKNSNDNTDTQQQIELLSTNNTIECANMEWVDQWSKLKSAYQACDTDMVLDNRHTKESDHTCSTNMKEHVPTISHARSCSEIPQILGENDRSLAITLFSKINLKIVVCLFILAVMVNIGFLSSYESFSSTLGNVQKVHLSEKLEVREMKQEAEHVVKVRRSMNINKYLIKKEVDPVVEIRRSKKINKYLIKRVVSRVVKKSYVNNLNTHLIRRSKNMNKCLMKREVGLVLREIDVNNLNTHLIRNEEKNNTAVTTLGGMMDPLLELNMASDGGLASLKSLSTGRGLSGHNQAERKWLVIIRNIIPTMPGDGVVHF